MMNSVSMGDMAQTFMLQRRNGLLKQEISRLTEELSTGQVAEIRQVLDGNYSYLTDIERSLDTLQGFDIATAEATHFATGLQTSLSRLGDLAGDLSETLLLAGTTVVGTDHADTVRNTQNTFESMVGVLNSQISGRNLYSGAATDTAPLPTAEVFLDELRLAMAGATTANDMMTAAQAWFDDPLGYAAVVYQGSANDLAPLSLSDTETVTLDVRADDDEIRNLLRNVAVAALANDPAFGLPESERKELFFASATEMLGSQDQLVSLQARVGFTEARIEKIAARNAAELTSFEFARNNLLAVDPYQTATELENVQFQLQSLYSITVRMSQLSLVNFL